MSSIKERWAVMDEIDDFCDVSKDIIAGKITLDEGKKEIEKYYPGKGDEFAEFFSEYKKNHQQGK